MKIFDASHKMLFDGLKDASAKIEAIDANLENVSLKINGYFNGDFSSDKVIESTFTNDFEKKSINYTFKHDNKFFRLVFVFSPKSDHILSIILIADKYNNITKKKTSESYILNGFSEIPSH